MNSNLAYQNNFREELIGGKVVAMAPASTNHNRISNNLNRIFSSYLYGKPCEPFGDGEKVFLTQAEHYVPDFMVVCDPEKVRHDGVHGAPDLVAEILSPGTAKNDRGQKKAVYEACGVREYWIIDPVSKSVEVYLLDGARFVLHDVYTLRPDWELESMTEAERSELVTQFKCSLFDDLDIALEDVFYRTF